VSLCAIHDTIGYFKSSGETIIRCERGVMGIQRKGLARDVIYTNNYYRHALLSDRLILRNAVR
jgi:hypothetical protein